MPSEARQKKIREKLNRAQKCSILGPQNLGSGGGPGPPGPPPWIRTCSYFVLAKCSSTSIYSCVNGNLFNQIFSFSDQKFHKSQKNPVSSI